jgi:hypothetical protein
LRLADGADIAVRGNARLDHRGKPGIVLEECMAMRVIVAGPNPMSRDIGAGSIYNPGIIEPGLSRSKGMLTGLPPPTRGGLASAVGGET